MSLLLDDIRAEFARFLTADPSAKFRMDAALAHVVTLAYQRGLDDGTHLDVSRLLHQFRELAKAADEAAMVLATISTDDPDESSGIEKVINRISTWAGEGMLFDRPKPNIPQPQLERRH